MFIYTNKHLLLKTEEESYLKECLNEAVCIGLPMRGSLGKILLQL